jgi:hypothetical protein
MKTQLHCERSCPIASFHTYFIDESIKHTDRPTERIFLAMLFRIYIILIERFCWA